MALDLGGGLFDGVLGGQRRELSVLGRMGSTTKGRANMENFQKEFSVESAFDSGRMKTYFSVL